MKKKEKDFARKLAYSHVPNRRHAMSDTAQKNLTLLKKGINFWARALAVRPKH